MEHGVDRWLAERARSGRRVSLMSVAVGLTIQLALQATRIPVVHRALHDIPILRFGLAGPPRVVELLHADAKPGLSDPLRDVGQVTPTRRGGRGTTTMSRAAHRAPPEHRTSFTGPGDAVQDLVIRALSSEGRVPIFQSDELVIERLVRPTYPERAHDLGIEGKVAVLAHVDTIGNVIEVAVMTPSGERELDDAARDAVWQCRFRPFRRDGAASEVYAVFRFAFRIY